MLISRLLPFSLLFAVSAASSVAAQSAQAKNPVAVPSTNSADLLSLNLKSELNPAKPLDRIRIEEYRPRLNQLGLAHILLADPEPLNQFGMPHIILGPDGLSLADTFCYAIRSYKVARDNPQSDSTHAVEYSTCQPATRFRMYTAEERVLSPKP